eukprot:s1313_g12.t1
MTGIFTVLGVVVSSNERNLGSTGVDAMAVPLMHFAALPHTPPSMGRVEQRHTMAYPRPMVVTPRIVVSASNLAPGMAPQVRNGWSATPWPVTPIPPSPRASLTHSARDLRIEAPRSWLNGAPVAILPPPAQPVPHPAAPEPPFRFDALAQQLQRLQEAKSIAANELLQSEKRIALRKAQLRQETFKAVRESGLLEALKRWPIPAPELPRPLDADAATTVPREGTTGSGAGTAADGWTTPKARTEAMSERRDFPTNAQPDDDLELPATSSTLPAPNAEPPPPPPPPALDAPDAPDAPSPGPPGPEPAQRQSRASKSPSASPRGRISPRRATGSVSTSAQFLEEAKHCSKALSRIATQVSGRNLRELRKLQSPPPQVLKIFEATAVLLGDATVPLPELLSDTLPQRLGTLDVARISATQRSRVKALLKLPDVQPDAIAAVCHPCASLSQWCECVMMFLSRTASLVPAASSRNSPPKSSARVEAAATSLEESGTPEKTDEEESKLQVEPDLSKLSRADLKAVRELTVTRQGVGSVIFHGLTDCSDVEVQRDIVLSKGFILVYPDPKKKPPAGCGLNKPATVTMFNCFAPGELLMDDPLVREDYKEKIRLMTEENKTCKFLDYDCQKGIWQFEVNRF